MSGTSPSKEKFCSIIGEIVDKTCDIIVDTEEALEYDAVELTVLLKSIGFRLNSFEFETVPEPDSNDIELDIRCKHSGITSKLLLNSKKCTCPERNQDSETNNSYWEIQGRGPQTPISRFKGIVKDTSCNLLPDISRKSANIARTTLAMLLQNYHTDFAPDKNKDKTIDVKTFADYLNIKMPNTEEISSASRTNSLPSINENGVPFQKSQSYNNLSSTNYNSLSSASPVDGESGNYVNGSNEIKCDNERTTDDSLTFPSLSSLKSDINDINELNFEFDYEPSEKDRDLVQKILKARRELDVALKLMKTKPGSINLDQLSDVTLAEMTGTPTKPKGARTMIKTRRSFPTLPTGRKSINGNGVANENSNRLSLQGTKTLQKTTPLKRDSFKSATTPTLQTKSIPIRRTSSGTHLKPINGNLTKGPMTKSNISKVTNTTPITSKNI